MKIKMNVGRQVQVELRQFRVVSIKNSPETVGLTLSLPSDGQDFKKYLILILKKIEINTENRVSPANSPGSCHHV